MDDKNQNSEEIKKLTQELEDQKSKYLRALADYQNLEKQTSVWKDEFSQYAAIRVVTRLLEVLDDLEKAQASLKDNGLALIINKLGKVLASEGLEEIDLEGKDFDPSLAEAISIEPGKENDKVTQVLQKGYRIKNKVVRPAKVVVSKIEKEISS